MQFNFDGFFYKIGLIFVRWQGYLYMRHSSEIRGYAQLNFLNCHIFEIPGHSLGIIARNMKHHIPKLWQILKHFFRTLS